jgi:hypothetical protein
MSDPFYRSPTWYRLRVACLARDPVCTTPGCGDRATHADHIVPRSQGGADALHNLRGLCTSCHNRRSARRNAEPRAVGCHPDGTPRDTTHWWNDRRECLQGGAADRSGEHSQVSPDGVARRGSDG